MSSAVAEKRAVLREATVMDMMPMVKMVERLHDEEARFTGGNGHGRPPRNAVIDAIAEAIVSPDSLALVVEKSGAILGTFVCHVEGLSALSTHHRVCTWWMGYAKRNPVFFKLIVRRVEEWAKEKGCTAIRCGIVTRNERVQRLMKKCGFGETLRVFEKEV